VLKTMLDTLQLLSLALDLVCNCCFFSEAEVAVSTGMWAVKRWTNKILQLLTGGAG